MSSRPWQQRIADIIEAIQEIETLTQGNTATDLEQDPLRYKAILYNFIIIGEAAASIPRAQQNRYPQILWREMSDMRNIVAHEYFRVQFSLVWKTIRNNLPATLQALQEIQKSL